MSIKSIAKRFIGDLLNPLAARYVARFAFDLHYRDLWERHGFHVVPSHFYCPIPDTQSLDERLWTTQSELVGIDLNEAEQKRLLRSVFPKFRDEYDFPMSATGARDTYYVANGTFESVDGEVLHCMIRHFLPNRVIEIGAGNSTLIATRACLLNADLADVETELITIDPYPSPRIHSGLRGLSTMIQCRVEEVNIDLLLDLDENDILFIDSSHVVKTGGDVNHEILEILPRLKRGVIVHVHDIYLPAEYPREEVLNKGLYFTEQYMLQAFLTFNNVFEIIWAGSCMHLRYPELLEQCFPSYREGNWWPASLWLRRKR